MQATHFHFCKLLKEKINFEINFFFFFSSMRDFKFEHFLVKMIRVSRFNYLGKNEERSGCI